MSEEEKEAIEQLRNMLKDCIEYKNSWKTDEDMTGIKKSIKALEIVLNLIDKLQKGNKYLQERLEFRVRYCNELEHELYEDGNYIHKDKIRDKIKELEDKKEQYSEQPLIYNILKNQLEELLGE